MIETISWSALALALWPLWLAYVVIVVISVGNYLAARR
jgi:hypothetical protein